MPSLTPRIRFACLIVTSGLVACLAQEVRTGTAAARWRQHDIHRPKPPVVESAEGTIGRLVSTRYPRGPLAISRYVCFTMRSSSQRDTQPFLPHELVELFRGKLQRIRLAPISDLCAAAVVEPLLPGGFPP